MSRAKAELRTPRKLLFRYTILGMRMVSVEPVRWNSTARTIPPSHFRLQAFRTRRARHTWDLSTPSQKLRSAEGAWICAAPRRALLPPQEEKTCLVGARDSGSQEGARQQSARMREISCPLSPDPSSLADSGEKLRRMVLLQEEERYLSRLLVSGFPLIPQLLPLQPIVVSHLWDCRTRISIRTFGRVERTPPFRQVFYALLLPLIRRTPLHRSFLRTTGMVSSLRSITSGLHLGLADPLLLPPTALYLLRLALVSHAHPSPPLLSLCHRLHLGRPIVIRRTSPRKTFSR